VGASPIPNWWGMLIASLSLLQLGTGVMLDHRYDKEVLRYFPVAVFYPLVYWMLMSVITVVSTPRGLLAKAPRGPTLWKIPRDPASEKVPFVAAVPTELVKA
jgi:poly-beta-1,6-N-acetyl-D-glucosamine synthase